MDKLGAKRWLRSCGLAGGLLLTCAPLALADDAPPPEIGAVDALQAASGKHPGIRANHAKGVVLDATFTPAPEAAALSKSAIFAGPPVKAIVRFSDPTGNPDIADNNPAARPKGMAVKFTDARGDETDMVMLSSKLFPVASAADFRDFVLAATATKPDSPKPTPIEKFLAAHPAAVAFIQNLPPTPASFATQTYYGLDAFRLVPKEGEATNVRFRWVPEGGEQRLTPDELEARSATFLVDEIGERVKAGGVKFWLVAQVGEKGDPTSDVTRAWPDDRKIVKLGELVVTERVPDSASAEKALVFLPNVLADGIEESDDPLIDSRAAAYAESFSRRSN
jgi:catalase